jgi:type IV pilus assembly protein PilB
MEAVRHPSARWPALGALLVRDGAVSEQQLENALERQRREPHVRLGEILVDEGYTTSTAVARVLAAQHELEFLELEHGAIDVAAAMLLSPALARRYGALPVRFLDNGSILVAVGDPTNVLFSDELRLALGLPVRICVASPTAISAAITQLLDNEDEFLGDLDTVAPDDLDETNVLDLDAATPAVIFVNKAIAKALDLGASDVHFTPQARALVVRTRIDGVMQETSSIGRGYGPAVASRLKIMGGLDIAERRAPQDGRVSIRRGDDSVDVRVATLPTAYGEKVTLRVLSQAEAPGTLEDLGMPGRARATLERAIGRPFGAVVVVGPTGSGKTTTLFACTKLLNTPGRQITTIEDPVEYRVEGIDQVEVNPRAGLTFSSGLRTILRSDPDVLLVGEIRDEETAEIAFRAAMTGHLILTTLHAQTAAAAVERLVDMGVERSILTTSINCVVAQRLVRRVCTSCSEATEPDFGLLDRAGIPPLAGGFVRAVGCGECGNTGYRGRIPIFEVMTMTDELAMLIGQPTREIEAMAISQGMSTLRQEGGWLAAAGLTTVEEVVRVVGETLR